MVLLLILSLPRHVLFCMLLVYMPPHPRYTLPLVCSYKMLEELAAHDAVKESYTPAPTLDPYVMKSTLPLVLSSSVHIFSASISCYYAFLCPVFSPRVGLKPSSRRRNSGSSSGSFDSGASSHIRYSDSFK